MIDNRRNLVIYGEGHINYCNALETTNQMKSKTVNEIPPWFIKATTFDYIRVVVKHL